MNQKKLEYIEDAGMLFEQFGMTRMAGRVFGCLVISDKDAVSFNDIKKTLNASKGSISGSTKQLIHTGLIEPVTLPGDRKTYYRPNKNMNAGEILKARTQQFDKLSRILLQGKKLKERDDDISEWLLEFGTFYSWVGGQIEELIDRWEIEKEKIINQ